MAKEHITVVSGLPRSGTSMIMRMLESGGMPVMTDRFRKADADNPLGYYEFEPVKRMDKDASWLPDAYGKAIKVIYILLYQLPCNHHYKVIFMKRSLDEVIASQKTMLSRRQEEGAALSDRQLMDSFEQQLQSLHHWMSRQENFAVLYVNHQDVLSDPNGAVAEVSRFLNVPLDTDAMIRTVDPALYRNRSKAFA